MTKSRREWLMLGTDAEFAAAFAGATIISAATSGPGDVKRDPYADIYWELSDGSWLAMEVSTGGGCNTCGYGAGEKTYWRLDPPRAVDTLSTSAEPVHD